MAKLRSKTPAEIQQALDKNRDVNFNSDPTIDGWVLIKQPAVTFTQGRQAKIPVLVGSNADEYTVLLDEEHDPKTVAQYRKWVEEQFWDDPGKILAAYPVAKDLDVRPAFRALVTDYNFGNGAHLVARDTVRAGQKSYLYFFSYPAKGQNASFGAHHGNELKFISGMFRKSQWGTPDAEDMKLVEMVGGYSVQFARTGNPNRAGLPEWPAFDPSTDRCLELGREIKVRATPHTDKYILFEQGLNARLRAARKPTAQ